MSVDNGWEMKNSLYGLDFLYQLYLKSDAHYEGRVTVPVLWDKQTQTIVSNESADIIRMFNTAFNHLTGNINDYYPKALRVEINELNDRIYENINNGVYRAGFAIRFDAVYFGHFKTNRQRLAGYPSISAYLRELFQVPGVSDTVDFEHIKTHYYASHRTINPTGIVPLGPEQDFTAAHGREGHTSA